MLLSTFYLQEYMSSVFKVKNAEVVTLAVSKTKLLLLKVKTGEKYLKRRSLLHRIKDTLH